MKFLLVLLPVLFSATTLPAAEKAGLNRDRLIAAYGHARNAAELAAGGATKKKIAKAGEKMSDDELRKEIGICADKALFDFAKVPPKKPAFLGVRSFDAYDLAELAQYIDWTPFFQTWELTGRFPAILDDPKIGEVARSLYDDAKKMLDRIIAEKWFKARATIGFWPANADGDDIAVYADDTRREKIATFRVTLACI